MSMKKIMQSAFVALSMLIFANSASARTSIHIGLGIGNGGWGHHGWNNGGWGNRGFYPRAVGYGYPGWRHRYYQPRWGYAPGWRAVGWDYGMRPYPRYHRRFYAWQPRPQHYWVRRPAPRRYYRPVRAHRWACVTRGYQRYCGWSR